MCTIVISNLFQFLQAPTLLLHLKISEDNFPHVFLTSHFLNFLCSSHSLILPLYLEKEINPSPPHPPVIFEVFLTCITSYNLSSTLIIPLELLSGLFFRFLITSGTLNLTVLTSSSCPWPLRICFRICTKHHLPMVLSSLDLPPKLLTTLSLWLGHSFTHSINIDISWSYIYCILLCTPPLSILSLHLFHCLHHHAENTQIYVQLCHLMYISNLYMLIYF